MKKQALRRILSLGLFVLMLMQAMPVWATAGGTFSLETREAENGRFCFQAADVDFGESHLYYDQLENDAQRAIYDGIVNATPENNVLEMTFTDIPVWNIPNEGFTQEFLAPIYAYMADVLLPAYAAASLDTPLLFWATSVQYGGNISHNGFRITAIYLRCEILYDPRFDAAGYTDAMLDLEQKLASLPFDDSQGNYSLLKQFHDYLCQQVVYIESANSHSIIGPLLEGKSVCEGYAESFKLFCDLYGIPCMVVTGTGITSSGSEAHAWNVVRMEDGKWYGVDVTWDDQTSRIYYEFFLVGGDTVPDHFQALSFNQSHVVENDFYQNGAAVLASPTLNSTAYDPEAVHQHEYSASVIAPTCTEGGYTVYTCDCGDSYIGDITEPTGHSYTEEVTDPTCTEGGYTTYTCTVCGDSYVDNMTEPTGHAYGDWVMTEPGVETHTCEHCGETETREAQPNFDTDGDGEVTEADAELLLSVLVGNAEADGLECDLDFDGELTIYDCVLLLQQIES